MGKNGKSAINRDWVLFLQPPPELVEILIKFTYEVLRVQPKDIIAFADVFFEQELRRRKAYGKDFG